MGVSAGSNDFDFESGEKSREEGETHILLRRVEVQIQVVLRGDGNDTEHDREGREARVREPHVTRARCVDART